MHDRKRLYLIRVILLGAIVSILFAFGGCGGGGGSSGSAASGPVSFSPTNATANYIAGLSVPVTIQTKIVNPSVFSGNTFYISVVDSNQVLSSNVSVVQVDSTTFTATMHTSATLASGHYTGTFQVQLCKDVACAAQFSGSPVSLPYDFTVTSNAPQAVNQHRLLVSEWGVGFANTPTGSVLTRSISVRDNYGGALAWTAVSDSPWLAVTSSGTTGGVSQITLTANPATLPAGAMSYANVTVSTTTSGVASAVVRVGVWNDTAAAVAMTKLPLNYSHIVADKIRPYVYANSGGTAIDVYNAYTAQKVTTLTGIGTALGAMTVSPDGSRLYALDTAARSMSVVDLTTMTALPKWPLDQAVTSFDEILAIRPNGVEVVVSGDGKAYTSAGSLGSTNIGGSSTLGAALALSASTDGRSLVVSDLGLSPTTLYAYDVDYWDLPVGYLRLTQRAQAWSLNGAGNGQDVAVSADGTQLYAASGAPYVCSIVDPTNLTLIGSLPGGSAYPTNVEVTRDGRVICGSNDLYGSFDLWVHSSSGAKLSSYKVGSPRARQVVVTPDGFIVVAQAGAPVQLVFVPIGP